MHKATSSGTNQACGLLVKGHGRPRCEENDLVWLNDVLQVVSFFKTTEERFRSLDLPCIIDFGSCEGLTNTNRSIDDQLLNLDGFLALLLLISAE